MNAELFGGRKKPLIDFLRSHADHTTSLYVAVAFVKQTGWRLLNELAEGVLTRQGGFEIVFGLDFLLTEPRTIRSILQLRETYPDIICRAYSEYGVTGTPNFHPKLYILERDDGDTAFAIGSSNLSRGGLRTNVELSIGVVTQADDPLAQSVLDTFRHYKDEAALTPTEEYLQGYEAAFRAIRRKGREAVRDPKVQEIIGELKTQENRILEASVTQLDLIVEAVRQLTQTTEFASLQEITQLAREEALRRGIEYDWHTFHNSVRGRLNENVLGKKTGRELFERPNNQPGSGRYRLHSP